ncbi:replicative DNA helicase [Priestia megaterium]|uniref:replicative DNA helicase n=1 Tax=Priestia megaterium TaxID=1404 RepID=UPI002877C558|nr:replicative DNA helicase [Priestia megaterium]
MSLTDKRSIFQVLGCLIKNPRLLKETQYNLNKDDFPEQFHKLIFAAITNLCADEVEDLDYIMIDSFLSNYDVQYKIFNDNNGIDYIIEATEAASLRNFNFNYNRVKKFTLLRTLESSGFDIRDIYDKDLVDPKEHEAMQEKFDAMSLEDITKEIDRKFLKIKESFLQEYGSHGQQAGKGMKDLKKELRKAPALGAPLVSKILTTIARGARLKKLYMRSAPTGVGKTRFSLGDATNLAVDKIYDWNKEEWVSNGTKEPALFVTTELEMDEIQTMMISFVSGVNEDTILDGTYTDEEEKVIDEAIDIIEKSPLWIEHLPDFDINDVERKIEDYVLNHGVKFVFFDYIHTSLKLLAQLAQESKGMKLREDNVLLMFVDRLKQLCNRLGVFIFTATQVSGDFKNVKDADQSLLRGAKAMADKIDFGVIARVPAKADLESIKDILKSGFYKEPNVVFDIYKNRRGKFVRVKLWSYADLGTCRTEDLFVTNSDYEPLPVEATIIELFDEEEIVEIEETNEEDTKNATNELNF